MDNSQNNKRIAKNTLLLYLRMVVVTIVSLYTARLTLILLGVEDFGIYNVVAGLVTFTEIITVTMTSATQRFLSYDLGKNQGVNFDKTFSMLMNVFVIITILLVSILELFGPYMLSNYLVIPHTRYFAAQIVFQIAIISLIFGVLSIPYNSALIAYEKMGLYAYFTIVDVSIRFVAVLSLYITPYDRLVTYGIINSVAKITVFFILCYYCRRNIKGCRYFYFWDKALLKKVFSYSGWSLVGSTNWVFMNQGQAILLNIFFGPVINGIKAVADKIRNTVFLLSTNFYMAVSPQIIKSYALGDLENLKLLLYNSTRYGYYILLLVCLPLYFNMREILIIWLGKEQVSSEMILFSQWSLIYCLVSVIEPPLTKIVQATGNVKRYELYVGAITLTFLPLCALIFYFGTQPYYSMVVLTWVYVCSYFYRIWHVNKILDIRILDYCRKTIFELVAVTFVIVFLTMIIEMYLENFVLRILASVIINTLVIFYVGFSKTERVFVFEHINRFLLRHPL